MKLRKGKELDAKQESRARYSKKNISRERAKTVNKGRRVKGGRCGRVWSPDVDPGE